MCVCTVRVWYMCSNRGVSGCESGPEAKVCLPRWTEEPAARAESSPSLAGSEERKRKITTKTLSQLYHSNSPEELTGKDLFNTVRSDHRGAPTKNSWLGN